MHVVVVFFLLSFFLISPSSSLSRTSIDLLGCTWTLISVVVFTLIGEVACLHGGPFFDATLSLAESMMLLNLVFSLFCSIWAHQTSHLGFPPRDIWSGVDCFQYDILHVRQVFWCMFTWLIDWLLWRFEQRMVILVHMLSWYHTQNLF